MLFRIWGCLVGPENSIFRKLKSVGRKKKPLTTELILHFYFPFKVFPENEREERQSARAIAIAPDRDRTGSRDRIEIAIAPDLATGSRSRSRLREIALDRDRRRRDLVKIPISRRRDHTGSRSPSTAKSSDGVIWVVACVFLNLCFPSSFPNTRKYFPENFLKCNQTPWKHFPFPEISIFGKYVFSGKRFTATKHSPSHCYKHGVIWKLSKLKHAVVKHYNINMTEVAISVFFFLLTMQYNNDIAWTLKGKKKEI